MRRKAKKTTRARKPPKSPIDRMGWSGKSRWVRLTGNAIAEPPRDNDWERVPSEMPTPREYEYE